MSDEHASRCFERSIYGISDQIDQYLLKLVRVALNRQRRALFIKDLEPSFESRDPPEQSADFHGSEFRRRQFR